MWVLLVCSMLGSYIVFYKLFYFIFQNISYTKVRSDVQRIIKNNQPDVAIAQLQGRNNVLKNAAAEAIKSVHLSRDNLHDSLRTYLLEHVSKLERHMPILSSLITITPILGLMGTVLGLMHIFQVISGGGIGNTEALSLGIAEALITTVAGLAIAVPLIVMNHYLQHRIEALALQIERIFLDTVHFCKQI
ncbi:MAG: MotA/TolQ/ExbB proton channel family protein [bacterium]